METERSSLVARDLETAKDMQLRVTPSEMKFLDALAGRVYRLPLTVHNLGRSIQKIRFQEPVKPQFKLILTNLDKSLASGLQTTAMVEYHPDKNEDMCDQLLISIGNKTIEIPLIGLIPSCQLAIEPEVNFGTLVASSKVYCKEISIINHGSVPGIFKIEYQGQLPIVIFPASGVVQPKSSVVIKVDFCADQPMVVNELAKVSLQDRPDIFLNIRAHVVEQIIELLNINNDKKLECISFGSVFFGTSKIERALLYNNSPEPVNWVAIMQDDSIGEELGTNIKQRTDVALNNLTYLRKIKSIDITTIISCVPNEGRLLPYQKSLITFCFSPKLIIDGQKNDPSHRQDYAVYLRFESVGSKDGFLRDDNQIIKSISPLVSNPTGQFVVKDLVQYKDHAPVAMLQSTMTHIHNHKINKELIKGALIAFPNDRAASIRSGEDHENFRTIFTKIPRYNYVDPDFAYTKFEKLVKKSHENYYAGYIKFLRNVRLQKEAHRSFTFTVNNMPGGHILVMAVVLPLGHSKVTFLEPRILFSNIPQGLTTWRKAILHNVGQNHAYFKVCDQSLLSMINIVPSQGIIPLGGLTVLNISCTPTVKEKFDTRAKVAIRCANDIDLRIGGSVEVADVEIHPNTFNFTGTYVGSTQIMPFLLKNKGITRARVEFNLEDADSFSLDFKGKSGKFTDPAFPDIFFLELEKQTSMECGIAFSPKEVATYNFSIQVRVNFFAASELDSQCCLSDSHVIPNRPPVIRSCHIQATVLQAPLTLSSTHFIFEIPLHSLDPNNRVTKTQNLVLHNTSRKDVEWNLDIRNTGKLFKDGIFKFSTLSGTLQPNEECNVAVNFCPKQPREYTADIPIHLNDNPVCYRMLHLVGEIKSPKLLFVPPFVFFTPVPLDVPAVMDVNILPQNYFRDSTLSVHLSPVKLLNGNEIQPLSVKFPKGGVIVGSSIGINAALTCCLSFKSSKPVSFFTNVLFCDSKDNCLETHLLSTRFPHPSCLTLNPISTFSGFEIRFSLPVTATAENCMLTIYSYMAIHLDEQKIIVKNEKDAGSVKAETKSLLASRETGLPSTALSKFSDPEPAKRRLFVGMEIIPETLKSSKYEMPKKGIRSMKKEAKDKGLFSPKEGTRTYDFFLKTVNAAQTWFSLFGWPEGPHFLHIPETVRRAQGACISHVLPEFLLEPEDYKKWIEITSSTSISAKFSHIPKGKPSVVIDMTDFEAWSKRSWTDVFLQIYKVLVLSRIVPYSISNLPPVYMQNSPKVNAYFASSNIYSDPERILLSWMNTNYENTRHVIWKNCQKGVIPPERWIVNFDKDLLDGLVFATVLGAYCPFLIESHFINMYTQPKSSEQYLHNCLIVVNVLREIGFDMDIQATDICDPNPIQMLMFCVYMYERLPTCLPKKVVPFHCTLHDTVFREIQLKNPSLKSLVYSATIVGRDASDFSLSQAGNTVTISAKNQITITLKFTSRFLHPAEASLLLISRPKNGIGGTMMTFALKGEVLNFKTIETIKCKSPCYKWKEVTVKVKNPFQASGDFNATVNSSGCDFAEGHPQDPNALKTSIKSNFIKEFFCSAHTLHLAAKGTSSLELFFLPFGMHTRYCVIILSNRKIGELIYILEGRGIIPLPSRFFPVDSSSPLEYSCSPEEVLTKDDPVLYLKCKLHQILDVDLKLPLTNEAKEKALTFAAQQQMSKIEYERRLITGTLESSSIRVAIALLGLTKIEMCMLFNVSKLKKPKSILYKAELSLPEHFDIPKTVFIPQIPETQVELAQYQGNESAEKTAADGSVPVPLRFVPLSPGRYPCKILLTSKYDVRLYCIEGVVNEERPEARFDFETPAFEPLTQNIPINNETKNEWKFQVTIEGEWFHGPPILYVGPGETVDYPLTFKPILECEIMGKLILQNEVDGMEHIFDIKGTGKRPLALEHIIIDCQVGEVTNKPIIVPNYTPSLLTFKVSSDLPIVWGNPDITIDPDNTVPYILHVCPWKRGIFKGTISFSVKSKHDGDSQNDSDEDQDRDQIPSYKKSLSELSDKFDEEKAGNAINNLRIWYHLEIHSAPGPPLEIIDMKCVALESFCIEVPLFNPKEKIIHFDVLFSSAAFSGLDELELFPLDSVSCIIQYSPACAGFIEESIVFQPDLGLEFWYSLKITTDIPEPTIMKEIYCDLGKEVCYLNYPVENLIIPPNSARDIPIHFRPSALGRASHQTSVIFHCAQASIPIPFQNPTKEDVLIDILLTGEEKPKRLVMAQIWDSFMEETSAFKISGVTHTKVVIKCQARKRLEEEVEVTLDGDFWGENPILDLSDFTVIPKRKSYAYYEDIGDIPMKREFEYGIEFESEDEEASLESCVAIYLIKKSYNANKEQITLVFSLIFTPKKPVRSQVFLKVECMTDGIWTFPMMLIATEPDVDGVFDIEGVGLFKESTVDFRLTSQTRYPESYMAFFLPSSDPEFFVKPQIGELLPKGTLITVGFIPTMYSRKYKATLAIQTANMYWLYEINGKPQVSILPVKVKAKVDSHNKMFDKKPARRRNFLYENAQLTRTGVSSTIKGAPLMLNKK
ncbi:hypothetical protein MJG53_019580 [Ovis ammon polii x Ovis aries]|uniref:Uncharacterized protein n=1 Tax=Ovis ammon polii x Ovis aries TaxID=2918886 RepID=A0ACB9U077_9CETA|nr:hypothetical protein MJG53_019580 [Ovis ammon polii x Ovis aries]